MAFFIISNWFPNVEAGFQKESYFFRINVFSHGGHYAPEIDRSSV
jgi:hypothetical protein